MASVAELDCRSGVFDRSLLAASNGDHSASYMLLCVFESEGRADPKFTDKDGGFAAKGGGALVPVMDLSGCLLGCMLRNGSEVPSSPVRRSRMGPGSGAADRFSVICSEGVGCIAGSGIGVTRAGSAVGDGISI